MAQKYKIGTAAIFSTEAEVLKAAAAVRSAGFQKFDAITPYPVHGMEEACGIQRSWIPYVTFVMGILGCLAGWARPAVARGARSGFICGSFQRRCSFVGLWTSENQSSSDSSGSDFS